MRTIALIAVSVLAFATVALAQPRVVNPRVTTDSTIAAWSAEEVVAQSTHDKMSDEEKAIACWRFMLDHYYHWFPPREAGSSEPVRDFAKAINSYGYGPCFLNAPVLTALWEAAGLKTRGYTITGHAVPEVFYDGAWHMLDADARAFHRKADGKIASVDEISRDMKLAVDPPGGKSDPFYPFGPPDAVIAPLVPWSPPGRVADLYKSRRNNYRYNKRAVMGHPMYLNLRPGMTLTLNRENVGKWYKFPKLPKDMVWRNPPNEPVDLTTGPVNVDGTLTWGNGTLVWMPDLKSIEPADLLWEGSKNVKLDGGKLCPADASKPAVAVLRVFCPWVLVESKAMVAALQARPKVELSYDGGVAWQELEPGYVSRKTGVFAASFDLPDAGGKYAYQLRLTWQKGQVYALTLENLFQVAQLSLPRLKLGPNKVTVSRGPDRGVVKLVRLGHKAAKDRYVLKSEGMNTPNSLTPKSPKEPGWVTYQIKAPAPLEAVSIGALMSLDHGKLPMVHAECSFDDGKTWTTAWKLDGNTNRQNSQFEEDARIDLPEGVTTDSALVRFTVRGDKSFGRGKQYGGINAIRLYGYYRLPQPAGARIDLTFAWAEQHDGKWQPRSVEKVIDAFPTTFPVICEGVKVRFMGLKMAPTD
jgi:hypothetical protein